MRTTAETFVKFSRKLPDSDEALCLAGCLGISRVEAAGYIALLVSFAVKHGEDNGCIDFITTKGIEDGCCWEGKRGDLLLAFCDSGVVVGERDSNEHPLTVSPFVWEQLAGDTIRSRQAARERQRRSRQRKQGK